MKKYIFNLYSSFVLCLSPYIQLRAETYARLALEEYNHRDYAIQTGIINYMTDESEVKCMRECSRRPACVSFSYNSPSCVCRLHNFVTGTPTLSEVGWRHLLMKGIGILQTLEKNFFVHRSFYLKFTADSSTKSYITMIVSCPLGWILYENSCYLFEDVMMESWQNAKVKCQQVSAELIDIENDLEQTFMASIAGSLTESSTHVTTFYGFWVGGTDADVETIWRWDRTGDVMGYTAWFPLEPDSQGDEDCIVADGDVNYEWRDLQCDELRNYICERKIQ